MSHVLVIFSQGRVSLLHIRKNESCEGQSMRI